jgi:hypothetical protein
LDVRPDGTLYKAHRPPLNLAFRLTGIGRSLGPDFQVQGTKVRAFGMDDVEHAGVGRASS